MLADHEKRDLALLRRSRHGSRKNDGSEYGNTIHTVLRSIDVVRRMAQSRAYQQHGVTMTKRPRTPVLSLLAATILLAACERAPVETPPATAADPGMWFFVLVKSSNYSQNNAGELTLLNYHFFSELFPKDGYGDAFEGSLTRHDAPDAPMPYVDRGDNYYIEGGHFDTVGDLDAAFPNGEFEFEIQSAATSIRAELTLSGPDGQTDIPEPVTIALYQDGALIHPESIDPDEAVTVRWSRYSNGRADPNGVVDDMIFVVVQDCTGERIVHTGLPFKEPEYLTFRAKELRIEPGTLSPGEPFAMFVEFPHVVDSVIVEGIPGFTSYATATYLDVHTTGEALTTRCLDEMPPMDTGQTDRG